MNYFYVIYFFVVVLCSISISCICMNSNQLLHLHAYVGCTCISSLEMNNNDILCNSNLTYLFIKLFISFFFNVKTLLLRATKETLSFFII